MQIFVWLPSPTATLSETRHTTQSWRTVGPARIGQAGVKKKKKNTLINISKAIKGM
jgi:hypothetical protein